MKEIKLPPWSIRLAIEERVRQEDLVAWANTKPVGRQFPVFINIQPIMPKRKRSFISSILP